MPHAKGHVRATTEGERVCFFKLQLIAWGVPAWQLPTQFGAYAHEQTGGATNERLIHIALHAEYGSGQLEMPPTCL